MSRLYAAVDLGGTTITCAIGEATGRILNSITIPTASHEGPDAVLSRIAACIQSFSPGPLTALGMGVPGRVHLATGVTEFLPNLHTQWRNIPVGPILAERLGCPVYLLNDCRAAALGELTFGESTARDFVLLMIGTGIGGGVVIDGKLRLGPLGAAGEVGHQTILPDGPLCGCGNHGCLEALASGTAISAAGVRLLLAGNAPNLHALTGGDLNRVTPQTMASANDPAIAAAIHTAATYLGIGIANLVTTLHPELILLGGGVSALGDLLLAPIRAVVSERVRMFPTTGLDIRLSTIGVDAGILGALALAIQGKDL